MSTKLTAAQEAEMERYRIEFTAITRSTERMDWELARQTVVDAHTIANVALPTCILRAPSLPACNLLGAKCFLAMKAVDSRGEWAKWEPQMAKMVTEDDVNDFIKAAKIKLTQKEIEAAAKDGRHNYFGGSFWGSTAAVIAFSRDVLGIKGTPPESFYVLERLARSCGWVWWHEDVVVIGDRPVQLHLDENGQLHNENGPSIAYPDGMVIYHWHGTHIPSWIIRQPEKITEKRIEDEPNQELRRIMIERYGYARYMATMPVKAEDPYGKLRFRRTSRGDEVAVVEVINGSPEPDGTYRTYTLAVPPETKTPLEGVAWSYRMTAKEYAQIDKRT